jgi:hypothetical protein
VRSCQLCSYSRTSQHFTEPERSLLCSQETSIGPYPEPDQSSPYHPILFLQDTFEYCPPTYVLVVLVVSFVLAFPRISCMHSYLTLFMLHALPISSSLTDHSNYIWRRIQVMKHLIIL